MPLPLSHIRVLDLSRVLAGPLATQYLADLGAEVIKVEPPGKGDDTRHWGPPFAVQPKDGVPGIAAYFMCVNRGKKSVTIDLTTPEGQTLLRDLAAKSDVMIENFKVGGLKKYGLDYASVKKINPRIVYCSITGFGQDGPYANRAGYDFVVQGMGGLMSVTGQPDGAPGAAPMKVGVAISDEMSGMNALSGILAALLGREKSGEGSYIEVSLLESTVHALINQASNYLVSGDVPVRLGNDHPTIVPYSALPTKDGHIILAIGNDGQFQRFCEAAGIGHVATDPKYAINSQRIAHREELLALISARLTQETSTYWIDLLESRAVPCGPIYRMDEMFQDPHIIARGVRRETTKGAAAPLPVVANPIRMPGQDTTSSKAPPMLGEDTDSVLSSILGLTPDKIATLRKSGAI